MSWGMICYDLQLYVLNNHSVLEVSLAPPLQAKSDTIDALEAYREKSEPTFLMYSVSSIFTKLMYHIITL